MVTSRSASWYWALSLTSCAGAQGHNAGRGFRSGDLQFAATFLHGENASGAAAMVIDDGIPQNSIDPGFGTSFRPQL
jgi:hypothetical protein